MLASLENARDIEGGAGWTETLLRNEVGRKSHGRGGGPSRQGSELVARCWVNIPGSGNNLYTCHTRTHMGLSVWGGRLAVVFQTGELMVSAPKPQKEFHSIWWTFSFQSFCEEFLISKIKFEPFSSSALRCFTYFRFPGFPTFSTSCKLDVFQNCYGTREGDVPPLPHKTRVIVSSYFYFFFKQQKLFLNFLFYFKKFLFVLQGFLFQERVGFWERRWRPWFCSTARLLSLAVTSQPEVGREKDKKKKVLRDQEVGRKEKCGHGKTQNFFFFFILMTSYVLERERESFFCARALFLNMMIDSGCMPFLFIFRGRI